MDYITEEPQGRDFRRQGPFEYNSSPFDFGIRPNLPAQYRYAFVQLGNIPDNSVPGFDTIPAEGTIPEKHLFSFDIYDLHDKGTDVKTADYSKRRMFPIEDFAVGNPTQLYIGYDESYVDAFDHRPGDRQKMKYVKR